MDTYLMMPMAGAGSRFFRDGYECPKPLIELRGKPFFYWAAMSVVGKIPLAGIRFVILREHIERFAIDRRIRDYFPQAEVIVLDHVLRGAVLTCMEGVKGLSADAPLLFNDCDHLFCSEGMEDLCRLPQQQRPDGVLLTFHATEPKYSFVALDAAGNVERTVEKQAISTEAICGAYYFNRKELFDRYAARYLQVCRYEEFFMSGVYNEMIADGRTVRSLKTQLHVSFGTPEEYTAAECHPFFEGKT